MDPEVLEKAGEIAGEARTGSTAEAAAGQWTVGIVEAALEDNFVGPYVPTPVADEVPEDLEILAGREPDAVPRDRRRPDRRAGRTPTGPSRPTCSATWARSRARRRSTDIQNPDKPYEPDRRGRPVRGGVDLRALAAGRARRAGPRGRRLGQRRPAGRLPTRRTRAWTSSSASTSRSRPCWSSSWAGGGRGNEAPAASGDGRGPPQRRDPRHGQLPDLRPRRSSPTGISQEEYDELTATGRATPC